MDNLIVFAIRNAVFTGFLYLLWKLFINTKGYFVFSRFYLLAVIVLSVPMALWQPNKTILPSIAIALPVVAPTGAESINARAGQFHTAGFVEMVYFGIVAVLLVLLFVRILAIIRLKDKCRSYETGQNYKIFYCEGITGPVSFYRWIFLPADIDRNYKELVIKHELAHIKQMHTIDLIIMEIAVSVMWFNPFVYLIRRDLKLLHEILADRQAIVFTDANTYIKLLTGIMFPGKLAIYNTFYTKQIKKRLAMITKSSKKSGWAVSFVALIALVFTGLFPAVAQNNVEDTTVLAFAQKMPEYPGGNKALRQFIADNITYPEKAKAQGIQGTVVVRFVIDKTGKVKNPEILRSVDPLLDKEALRVISKLQDFTPAENDGKPVSVYFTMPIVFRLDEK